MDLGIDFIVNLGPTFYAGQAQVSRFSGGTQYQLVGSVPVSFVADGMDVGIPLSLLGADDGRMNFRVIASSQVSTIGFSTILDYMPDIGRPAAVVQ